MRSAAIALMMSLAFNGSSDDVLEAEVEDNPLSAEPPECKAEVYIEEEERDWELVRKIEFRRALAVLTSPAHFWHCAKKALGKARPHSGVGYTY